MEETIEEAPAEAAVLVKADEGGAPPQRTCAHTPPSTAEGPRHPPLSSSCCSDPPRPPPVNTSSHRGSTDSSDRTPPRKRRMSVAERVEQVAKPVLRRVHPSLKKIPLDALKKAGLKFDPREDSLPGLAPVISISRREYLRNAVKDMKPLGKWMGAPRRCCPRC